jgi:hypothetical protein
MKVAKTLSYESDDGKMFGSVEECKAYERSLRFAKLAKISGPMVEALPLTGDDWRKANAAVRETATLIEEAGVAIGRARREAGDLRRGAPAEAPAKAARKPVKAAKAPRAAKAAGKIAKANGGTPTRQRKPKGGNGAAAPEAPSSSAALFDD